MAKGRSSRGSAHGTPSSLTTLLSPSQPSPLVTSAVADVERLWQQQQEFFDPNRIVGLRGVHPLWDERRYHPQKPKPTHAAIRSATQLYHSTKSIASPLRFRAPNLVTVCIKRNIRKEVLHALKRTRKGSQRGNRRRNQWSNIKC